MTNEETKIQKFIEVEPTLTEKEYKNQIKALAKELGIKKGDVEDLMDLTETSYCNSQVFEKALKSYQNQ
jgi:glutamate racemase